MRKFLMLLSNIGRFLMFFEKSLSTGHEEELIKELKENQESCEELKKVILERKKNEGVSNARSKS